MIVNALKIIFAIGLFGVEIFAVSRLLNQNVLISKKKLYFSYIVICIYIVGLSYAIFINALLNKHSRS